MRRVAVRLGAAASNAAVSFTLFCDNALPPDAPRVQPDAPPSGFSVPRVSPPLNISNLAEALHGALEGTGLSRTDAAARVVTDEDERGYYASVPHVSWHVGSPPSAVVIPRSTEEVAAVVRACAARGVALVCRAGGTSVEGQCLPPLQQAHALPLDGACTPPQASLLGRYAPVVVLDVSRMRSVLAVYAEDLTARVQPGVGWEELGTALAPYGLTFPVDPGPGACVGGMVGTGCSGTHACRHGAMKANVLSLTAVAADGTVFRTGTRARKSVSGLDLTSLLVGSEGTLGVVTEATLRLAPLPERTLVAVSTFDSTRAACSAVASAVRAGVRLGSAELLDARMARVIAARDASLLPAGGVAHVLWKLEGFPASVDDDAERVRALAASAGARTWTAASGPDGSALWEARKTALYSVQAAHPGSSVTTCDVCVPLSSLPALLEEFEGHERDLKSCGAPQVAGVCVVAHAADGNAHHLIAHTPEQAPAAAALADWLARAAIRLGGTCTGEHGVGETKLKYLDEELGPGNARVARAIKSALDPHGILNPGKKIPPGPPADSAVSTQSTEAM